MATMIEQMDQLFLRQMNLERLVRELAQEIRDTSGSRSLVLAAQNVISQLSSLEKLERTEFKEE